MTKDEIRKLVRALETPGVPMVINLVLQEVGKETGEDDIPQEEYAKAAKVLYQKLLERYKGQLIECTPVRHRDLLDLISDINTGVEPKWENRVHKKQVKQTDNEV